MKPFTNIHTHVFNSSCAPDNFLRILPMNVIRRIPGTVKTLLDSKVGRILVHTIAKTISGRASNKRKEFDKYIAFLDVGLQNSQMDIFRMAFDHGQQFDPSIRIIGLTMNMDYMDSRPSENQKPFETQLEQVKDIKRFYPRNFFPFLGIDPRHKGGVNMVNWAKDYFEKGVTDAQGVVFPYFCGIKLYPALGFFPFDPRLKELYSYAEQNEIPVMTHTTRVGSQYIGAQIESLIPKAPDMLGADLNANTAAAKDSIIKRIATFYNNGWVKNSKIGDNDFACDLFGHPENYILLLENFPKLKICLAHMGGSNEILTNPSDSDVQKVRKVDSPAWFDRIQSMMIEYPNLYTDISYTLSSFGNEKEQEVLDRVIKLLGMNDKQGQPLAKRVLFGTDFFMTEQEARETELYSVAKEKLAPWFDLISRDNPQDFIRQPL
jgi:predicted TIM-barrel fold metal-dependent hydrolase